MNKLRRMLTKEEYYRFFEWNIKPRIEEAAIKNGLSLYYMYSIDEIQDMYKQAKVYEEK